MEAPSRRSDPSVAKHLFDQGYDFEFFQAVRLLLRLYPYRQPVGHVSRPGDEVVRFSAHLSTSFPPSSIHEIDYGGFESPHHMVVAFFGLVGPKGVLPSWYTEHLIANEYEHDHAAADFFGIFHHRLLSLFYRAWEKHRVAIGYERDPAQGLTPYLFDLIGLGLPSLRNRLPVPDESLLLYAGLLAQRPHSAAALAGILRDYFRVAVEIQQFLGRWFDLPESSLSHLHRATDATRLGFGAIAGDEVWNHQARFRVRLGPLSYERFTAFLPGGKALAALSALTRHIAGPSMQFDIQLILLAPEVPVSRATDEGERPIRLGLTSWLDRQEFRHDAADLILEAD